MPDKYLSLTQAADAWNISRQAIWLAVRLGRFPAGTTIRIGQQWAVTAEGIQAVFGEPRKKKRKKKADN